MGPVGIDPAGKEGPEGMVPMGMGPVAKGPVGKVPADKDSPEDMEPAGGVSCGFPCPVVRR